VKCEVYLDDDCYPTEIDQTRGEDEIPDELVAEFEKAKAAFEDIGERIWAILHPQMDARAETEERLSPLG